MRTIKIRNMQPGDIVSPPESTNSFDSCIVVAANGDGTVTLFRPYATCHGFTYGDPERVIPLIGSETYTVRVSSEHWRYWGHRRDEADKAEVRDDRSAEIEAGIKAMQKSHSWK